MMIGHALFVTNDGGRIIDEYIFGINSSSHFWNYINGDRVILFCFCRITRGSTTSKYDVLGNVISSNGYGAMPDCLIEVIGVIGADVTGLVTNIFATTNVSKSEQSVASALVGTAGSLFGAVYSALVAALISGLTCEIIAHGRHRRKCYWGREHW
jgi:hypothetical protein